jgi:type III restriction enzyme
MFRQKNSAACGLWVPAINNHGGFGRWALVEVTDPPFDPARAAVELRRERRG